MASRRSTWTTTTLQTFAPMILAVHGVAPIDMLIAAFTSLWVGVAPVVTRSQALAWAQAGIENTNSPKPTIAENSLRMREVLLSLFPARSWYRPGPSCRNLEATQAPGLQMKRATAQQLNRPTCLPICPLSAILRSSFGRAKQP